MYNLKYIVCNIHIYIFLTNGYTFLFNYCEKEHCLWSRIESDKIARKIGCCLNFYYGFCYVHCSTKLDRDYLQTGIRTLNCIYINLMSFQMHFPKMFSSMSAAKHCLDHCSPIIYSAWQALLMS